MAGMTGTAIDPRKFLIAEEYGETVEVNGEWNVGASFCMVMAALVATCTSVGT